MSTSCPVTPSVTSKVKIPNVIVKLVQRFNPKPIPNACIRYDKSVEMWAILDPKRSFETIQHFKMGVIENVKFETAKVLVGRGCGSRSDTFGLAYGDLYLHKASNDMVGAHNLGFNGSSFFNEDNMELKTASKVVLMENRRAVYFK